MIFLVLAAGVFAYSVYGVVKAVRREIGYWSARRTGVQLQAEVVDSLATSSGRRGAYRLTPIVRYRLDERPYEAAVVNATSVPRNRGEFMTVVVSPANPYEPYDRYQGMGSAARGDLLLFVLGAGVLALALALL